MEVEINTIPGYLPQRNSRAIGEVFASNVETLFGPGSYDRGGHRTGSTDMGDLAHIMPVVHPYVSCATGRTHGADFRITEPEHAYLTPAKLLASSWSQWLVMQGSFPPRLGSWQGCGRSPASMGRCWSLMR